MLTYINDRASVVPLKAAELDAAAIALATGPICVSRVQRRLGIGWNRAADLVVELKGIEALSEVARRLFQRSAGTATNGASLGA